MPGNVRIAKGEANLPMPSVINLTQLRTVEKASLIERVGRIHSRHLRSALVGLAMVLGTENLKEPEEL